MTPRRRALATALVSFGILSFGAVGAHAVPKDLGDQDTGGTCPYFGCDDIDLNQDQLQH